MCATPHKGAAFRSVRGLVLPVKLHPRGSMLAEKREAEVGSQQRQWYSGVVFQNGRDGRQLRAIVMAVTVRGTGVLCPPVPAI